MWSLFRVLVVIGFFRFVVGQLNLPVPAGTVTLPISPNPGLLDLSSESRLFTQLRSWGIDIKLDLNVEILGLDLLKTRPRRSRDVKRGLNLNLNLDAGLDRIASGLVDVGLGGLQTTVKIGSWGQADSTTRGERGDSAVCPLVPSVTLTTDQSDSGSLLSKLARRRSPYLSFPIPALVTYSCSLLAARHAICQITHLSTQQLRGHSQTLPNLGMLSITMNPAQRAT